MRASASTRTRLQHAPHYVGIFVVAGAVLAYQVLLTRLFSAVLYYHFAYVGISLAMLGMTLGAQRVFGHPQRFAPARLEPEWVGAALGFSVSSAVLTLAFIASPALLPRHGAMSTVLVFVPFVVPFYYSGICVTLLLTKSSSPVGALYAADLVGAALGCLLVVAALWVLDPVALSFALAALTALAAWVMASGRDARLARTAGWLAAAWLIGLAVQAGLYASGRDHLRIRWDPSQLQSVFPYERWNAYSHISIGPLPASTPPMGWGFGRPQDQRIEQRGLIIDASAGTILTRFDGDLAPLAFLANDVINAAYHIRPIDRVAVIGVGGGRDILSALRFGATHITGIEMNPAIIGALTTDFADFTGHLHRRPEVSLVQAEARSWLSQSAQAFDLIQISLIDTWAATAAGGLALAENKLYTVEAWQEFMARLTPGGMLSVSRWFEPRSNVGEFYRMLAIAAETLKRRGVPAERTRQHILALRNIADDTLHGAHAAWVVTVVVAAEPFSADDIARARQAAASEGFRVMLDPDTAWDATSAVLASGAADARFHAALPIDVSASTDDRPFFFYVTRLKDVFGAGANREAEGLDVKAIHIIALLLGATLAGVAAFVAAPLLGPARAQIDRGALRHLLYFIGIGVGFMLVEISQMQRLIIFLGHPVYGLTVILFTLLLFGGLGSLGVRPPPDGQPVRGALPRVVALCLVLVATGLATPFVTDWLKHLDTALRVLASVALLAPVGYCMGMMFPIGIAISRRHRALHPWFWGINGATSVFASVLGVALSMQFGIAAAYWTGAAAYLACLLVVVGECRSAEAPAAA